MGCRPTQEIGLYGLLDEVNRDEEANPDHVDEVPVVRHHDGCGCLGGRELRLHSPQQDNQEGDHAS